MKIGVIGCSHSSTQYGNPWHHYMGLDYGCEIMFRSSSGAGNEVNIPKIKMRCMVKNIIINNKRS